MSGESGWMFLSAQLYQQPDQLRAVADLVARQCHQRVGVVQCALGLVGEATAQFLQHAHARTGGALPPADAPGVEVMEVGEVYAFQEGTFPGRLSR